MMHTPGVCRYCHCTESDPCSLREGDTCCWLDKDRTVCSGDSCRGQFEADKKQARTAPRPRRRSSAEVYELQVEERKARARRYRDAAKARGLIRPKGGAA